MYENLLAGQFPGPTIEARSGDILEVNVWNLVEEGVSIHWHGLHMRGTASTFCFSILSRTKLTRCR